MNAFKIYDITAAKLLDETEKARKRDKLSFTVIHTHTDRAIVVMFMAQIEKSYVCRVASYS